MIMEDQEMLQVEDVESDSSELLSDSEKVKTDERGQCGKEEKVV